MGDVAGLFDQRRRDDELVETAIPLHGHRMAYVRLPRKLSEAEAGKVVAVVMAWSMQNAGYAALGGDDG